MACDVVPQIDRTYLNGPLIFPYSFPLPSPSASPTTLDKNIFHALTRNNAKQREIVMAGWTTRIDGTKFLSPGGFC